jgi:hypothetical protein
MYLLKIVLFITIVKNPILTCTHGEKGIVDHTERLHSIIKRLSFYLFEHKSKIILTPAAIKASFRDGNSRLNSSRSKNRPTQAAKQNNAVPDV